MVRWSWLWLAALSLFVFGLGDNSRGPVYPDVLKEFMLSDAKGSLFFLFCSAAAVINNLAMNPFIERWGPSRTVLIYTIVQALGFLLLGFSGTYGMTLLGSAVLGASAGGLCVGQNALAAASASSSKRRQALSALHCVYGFSSLIAPLLVSLFYDHGWGWRAVFTSLFVGSIGVFAYALQVSEPSSPLPKPATLAPALPPPRLVMGYYALLFGLYVTAEVGLSSRLVLYARRENGYPVDTANFLLAGFFLGLFLGRLCFALAPLRSRSLVVLFLSVILALICFSLGLACHPLWLALSGLFMSVYYPCAIALIHEDFVRESIPRTSTDANLVASWSVTGQCFALVVMHFAIGELSDKFGLGRALWLGPLALAAVLGLLLLHPKVSRRYQGFVDSQT